MNKENFNAECSIGDVMFESPLEAYARLFFLKESLPDGWKEAEQCLIENLRYEANKTLRKNH